MKRINKFIAAGLTTTTLVVTGLVGLPAISGMGPLGTQKAEAACLKHYTVIWNVAGLYREPDGALMGYAHQGDQLYGPSGIYLGDWVKLTPLRGSGNYIKRDAVYYQGCW